MRTAAFSWLLLAVAFSPVLIDLVLHWLERPWAAYSVLFLPLFGLELRRSPQHARRAGIGWALLCVSLTLELILVAGGLVRVARLALVLGAVGMALIEGRPRLRATLLLLWLVPVPNLLVSAASPWLVSTWAHAAAALLQGLGRSALVEVHANAAVALDAGHGALMLTPADGGLGVAALATGLAWYAGCRRGWALGVTAVRAVGCAWIAAPVQILVITGAAWLLDGAGSMRPGLELVPWMLVAGFGGLAVGLSSRPT